MPSAEPDAASSAAENAADDDAPQSTVTAIRVADAPVISEVASEPASGPVPVVPEPLAVAPAAEIAGASELDLATPVVDAAVVSAPEAELHTETVGTADAPPVAAETPIIDEIPSPVPVLENAAPAATGVPTEVPDTAVVEVAESYEPAAETPFSTPAEAQVPAPETQGAEPTPVADTPAADVPLAEAIVTDAQATDAPIVETVIADTVATEAPVAEAVVAEAPVHEAPVAGAVVAEAPIDEGRAAEAVVPEVPATESEPIEVVFEEASAEAAVVEVVAADATAGTATVEPVDPTDPMADAAADGLDLTGETSIAEAASSEVVPSPEPEAQDIAAAATVEVPAPTPDPSLAEVVELPTPSAELHVVEAAESAAPVEQPQITEAARSVEPVSAEQVAEVAASPEPAAEPVVTTPDVSEPLVRPSVGEANPKSHELDDMPLAAVPASAVPETPSEGDVELTSSPDAAADSSAGQSVVAEPAVDPSPAPAVSTAEAEPLVEVSGTEAIPDAAELAPAMRVEAAPEAEPVAEAEPAPEVEPTRESEPVTEAASPPETVESSPRAQPRASDLVPEEEEEEEEEELDPDESRETATATAEAVYNETLKAVGRFFTAANKLDTTGAGELPIADVELAGSKIEKAMTYEKVGDCLVGLAVGAYPDHGRFIVPHSVNVAILAQRVARQLGLDGTDLHTLTVAALVHDVGTVKVPNEVFYKEDSLSNDEWEMMRQRPALGNEILLKLGAPYRAVAEIAHQVHERLDSNGYPRSLHVDAIALEASILGAVDIFEAFIHPRPYKKTVPAAALYGVDNLMRMSHQFGDGVLKALVRSVGLFPVGTYVKLNSGEVAKVLRGRPETPMRPEVEVVFNTQQRNLTEPRYLDLKSAPHLYVFKPLSPEELTEFGLR